MANSWAETSQELQRLTQALQQGQAGLEQVVAALHHENIFVQTAAYHLLSDRPEPRIQWARLWYAPYHAFRQQFQIAGKTSVHQNSSYPHRFVVTPDSQELVVVDIYGGIQIWSLRSGDCVRTLPADGSFRFSQQPYVASKILGAIALHPDGQMIWIATTDGTIIARHLTTGETVCTLPGKVKYVHSIAIDPDGQWLLVGSHIGEDGIDLWNLATQTVHVHLNGLGEDVAIAPDGAAIATRSHRWVSLWDLQGNLLRVLPGQHMAFLPDGQHIVTSGEYAHLVQIWQVQTGELLHQFAEKDMISGLVVSADGQVVILDCQALKIRSLTTGALLGEVSDHRENSRAIALSPDSYSLISGGKTIQVHRNRRSILLSESTLSDFDLLFWTTNRRQTFDPRFQMAGYTEEALVRNVLARAAEYDLAIAVDELRRRIKRVERGSYYRYVLSYDEQPLPDHPLNLERPDIDQPTATPSRYSLDDIPYNNTEYCP